MNPSRCLIITTIFQPNKVLSGYAEECFRRDIDFIIVGDRKSPPDFSLPGSDFWSIERQKDSGFMTAGVIPENHYARKNIGYLASIEKGHDIILETDDDNIPYRNFWNPSDRKIKGRMVKDSGWINMYRLFTDDMIWPRGFPLEFLSVEKEYSVGPEELHDCPIQQGLTDDNPDVDAVYRLTRELPVVFEKDLTFALGKGSWCPFNSQNTVWYNNTFPLLYLPSKCSFRMTDIWRSFVAQRIAWEYGWKIAFHSPTVSQERNEHNLLRDFDDEVPGYLHNEAIGKALESLNLSDRMDNIFDNLLRCYEVLIGMDLVGAEEMDILKLWNKDLQRLI